MPAEPRYRQPKAPPSMGSTRRPRRMPHSTAAVQALADLAPELGLRWVVAETCQPPSQQRTLSPALYRALISYMLRAMSRFEAVSAFDALRAAISLPIETPGAPLGFTSETLQADVANILGDLTMSAARDEPLLPSSHALRFYAEAGHGAADADEYNGDDRVHTRAAFTEHEEKLDDVRTFNLAQMITLVAMLLEQRGPTAVYISDAVARKESVWLAPFTDWLPKTAEHLNSGLRDALKRLYAAYIGMQRENKKQDIRTRLVATCMSLSSDRQDAISLFLECIGDSEMRVAVCRSFLKQRFQVQDDIAKPLSLMTLWDTYFAARIVGGRFARVYPAVLASLIMGWIDTASSDQWREPFLRIPAGSRDDELVRRIKMMKSSRKRLIASCDLRGRDLATFNAAVSFLTMEVMQECSQFWT